MTFNLRQLLLSIPYAAALSWLLLSEIVPHWGYMNYSGEFSFSGLVTAFLGSIVLGMSVPDGRDVRSIIISALNYVFFIPSVIYASFSNQSLTHFICIFFAYISIYKLSYIKIPAIIIFSMEYRGIILTSFSLIITSILAQAAFGGFRYFNLNPDRVYEFRAVAASDVPAFFGYISSNIASVLIPISIVLSAKRRGYVLLIFTFLLSIVLFGMTSHKSVIFIPFSIVFIYYSISIYNRSIIIGLSLSLIPVLSIIEILYINVYVYAEPLSYFTSYIVRRVLFTPAMLDGVFIEFFSDNEKYYWASSRFGSWAYESPYPLTAPYLIGEKYFSDPDTAANTGIIGSGYANAGIFGVFFYSLIVGMIISILNSYGERIGHSIVASVSFITIFFMITSTDVTSAVLSHGLLLLLVVLAFFPRAVGEDMNVGSKAFSNRAVVCAPSC